MSCIINPGYLDYPVRCSYAPPNITGIEHANNTMLSAQDTKTLEKHVSRQRKENIFSDMI